MATTATARQQRNDIRLDTIWSMMQDLPEVAREWESLPSAERAGYQLAWDNCAGSVASLISEYGQGELTTAQRWRFLDLLKRLQELRPPFDELSLASMDLSPVEPLLAGIEEQAH